MQPGDLPRYLGVIKGSFVSGRGSHAIRFRERNNRVLSGKLDQDDVEENSVSKTSNFQP